MSFKRYYSRPPYLGHHGHALFSPRGQTSGDTPGLKVAKESGNAIPLKHIHLKATLKSGEIHLKSAEKFYHKTYLYLIDDSASTSSLIDENGWSQIQHHVESWAKRQACHNHFLKCSSLEDGTCHAFGKPLWRKILSSIEKNRYDAITLISDFHGELPRGPLWTHIAARSDSTWIRLCHPLPDPVPRLVEDIENPENTYLQDESVLQHIRDWNRKLNRILSHSSARYLQLKAPSWESVLEACLMTLTMPPSSDRQIERKLNDQKYRTL